MVSDLGKSDRELASTSRPQLAYGTYHGVFALFEGYYAARYTTCHTPD